MSRAARCRGQSRQDLGAACSASSRASRRARLVARRLPAVLDRSSSRTAGRHRALLVRGPGRPGNRRRARARSRRGGPRSARSRRTARRASRRTPRPRLYLLRDGHPARAVRRARRARARARVSEGLLAAAPPAELEGCSRTSSRTPRAATSDRRRSPSWSARRCSNRGKPRRLVPRAGAALRPRARSRRDRAPLLSPRREFAADAAAPPCSAIAARARRRAAPARAGERAGRRSRGSPATEPLYTVNPFDERGPRGAVLHAPADSPSASRASRALDPDWQREACERPKATKKGPPPGALSSK